MNETGGGIYSRSPFMRFRAAFAHIPTALLSFLFPSLQYRGVELGFGIAPVCAGAHMLIDMLRAQILAAWRVDVVGELATCRARL